MKSSSKVLMYALVLAAVLAEVGFVAAQMQHRATRITASLQTATPEKSNQPAPAPKSIAATSDEAAIRQVLIVQTTAWNTGNIESFMQSYKDAPDTTFIGTKVRLGYQPILENYRKNYGSAQKMGTLTFSELNVRLLDPRYAIVTGRFHLSRLADKKDKDAKNDGVFSLVWEKTDAGWKIILDHTS